jgi:signal transduction histidine kinase
MDSSAPAGKSLCNQGFAQTGLRHLPADRPALTSAFYIKLMSRPAHSRKLVGPYSKALQDYLRQPRKMELRRAGELGRDAMESGLGLAEMSAIHHESVRLCLSGQSLTAQETTHALTAAGKFLAGSMAPFEANRREFRRSNTVLRYQNGKLEDQVNRVSRVVFDEAMQLLAAAGLALDRANCSLPATTRGNLYDVQSLLDQIGEQLAACTVDLQPRVLEDLGLGAAIQSLSRRFQAVAQIDISADAAGLLEPKAGLVLYRAVQEALTNAGRHARARNVEIRLYSDGGGVQCSVRDDGIGFDSSRLFSGTAERGSGLLSIWESLRLIGGTLAVHSRLGGGTEVAITIGRKPAKLGGSTASTMTRAAHA